MDKDNLYHAVVIAIENDHIIVLDTNGTFYRLKYKEGLTVGDQIYFFDTDIYRESSKVKTVQFKPIIRTLLMAALVLIFVGVGYQFFNTNNDVYAAVSFGTQDGVQVELNKQQEIIQILTPEGKAVDDNWLGHDITEATPYLLEAYGDKNHMKDTLIGLSSNHSDWLEQYENFLVKEAAEADNVTNMIVIKGDLKDYQNAQKDDMLLGDYQLASSQIDFWEISENGLLSSQEKQEILGNQGQYYDFTSNAPAESLWNILQEANVPQAFRAALNTAYQMQLSLYYSDVDEPISSEETYQSSDANDDAPMQPIQPVVPDDDWDDDDDDWDDDDDDDDFDDTDDDWDDDDD